MHGIRRGENRFIALMFLSVSICLDYELSLLHYIAIFWSEKMILFVISTTWPMSSKLFNRMKLGKFSVDLLSVSRRSAGSCPVISLFLSPSINLRMSPYVSSHRKRTDSLRKHLFVGKRMRVLFAPSFLLWLIFTSQAHSLTHEPQ